MENSTIPYYIPAKDEGLSMANNPTIMADDLEAEHGLEAAYRVVLDCSVEAIRVGDKYTLSVWREVKSILRDRVDAKNDMNA